MKIAVVGAGGIGAVYGALLARAGHAVTFVARGEHLRAMRGKGLRIESKALGDMTVTPVTATDDLAAAGAAELVLLTMKAYDLEATAKGLAPSLGKGSVAIPLQNGVRTWETAAALLGKERVLPGVARVSGAIVAPGVVKHDSGACSLIFGEAAGGLSDRGKAIAAVLTKAGIGTTLTPDIAYELWLKFIRNCAAAGTASACGSPMRLVLGDPDTKALFVGAMREIWALARAKAIPLPTDVVEAQLAEAIKTAPNSNPSMLQDVLDGKRIELDANVGTTVRIGRELGIPTPIHSFYYAALKHRINGKGA